MAKPKKKTKPKKLKIVTLKATAESRNRRIKIAEVDRILDEGELFETTEDRIDTLVNGNNPYGIIFAEVIPQK